MKHSLIRGVVGIAVLSLLLPSLVAAEMKNDHKFKTGERICFIGDSITHNGSYHNQILLFYVTRYPNMRLQAWNCGISGDTASGAVKRYEWDIAPHQATTVTIMMGMNDVGRELYAAGKSGPDIDIKRQTAIENNIANMDKLASLLAHKGTRIIFLSPSIFDQTGNQKNDKLTGVNDALKSCGVADRNLAEKYHGDFIDFNTPMDALNRKEQKKNPEFTLIGGDRIHPGPVGHFVMAYLFLKGQEVSPIVSMLNIDATGGKVAREENCKISNLKVNGAMLSFDCQENALPFPVDAAFTKALELIPFIDQLNQEMLFVTGLKEGLYELLIDGRAVSQVTADNLKNGLNLALLRNTPQYKQAIAVQGILGTRAGIESKLRTIAHVEHSMLSGLKPRNSATEQKFLQERLEQLRRTQGRYNQYYISVIESYLKIAPEKKAMERQIGELLERAYVMASPQVHSYMIRQIK